MIEAPSAAGPVAVRVGVVLFALTTAALAGAGCVTLGGGPRLLPLPEAYDQAADHATSPSQSQALSQLALEIRPVDAAAWVRLAGLGGANHAKPGDDRAAMQALDHSYSVAPYASQVLEARVLLAYSRWSTLTPDLQAQVISEVKASWQVAPQRQRLLATASRIKDPAGALALASLLFTLRLQADADAAARRASDTGIQSAIGR